ncbi:MAG: hypothetical protein PHC64_04195 [Candidatus Gastranaerophilales bacterium]|nr:hypothetical protein [Candidatus Gastranaerophilales bacterium]
MEWRLASLIKKLNDLHTYSMNIADGKVSMSDFANTPGSMVNNLSVFMRNSHGMASNVAQQRMAYLMQYPGAQRMNQQQQQFLLSSLYSGACKDNAEKEKHRLHQEEEKINQEKSYIETRLKMLNEQETTITQALEKAAKDSAPKFV